MNARYACVGLLGSLAGCGAAGDTTSEENVAVVSSGVTAVADGDYVFKSVSSGKCLDVAAASTADGAAVQQWDCNGTGAQLFHVSSVGGGYVKIVNAASNKALDVTDGSTADGALIQQWAYGGGTNQQFELFDAGNSQLGVRARHSGKVLDVKDFSLASGARVQQWTWFGSANQRWMALSGGEHRGKGTFYTKFDDGGHCSFGTTGLTFFGAMNHADYASSAACGACADISGPDGSVRVRITNECPGCAPGDIDLSEQAFAKLAPVSWGRIPIRWVYVPCDDISGPIVYRFKEGSNPFWAGIQIRNHVRAIASVAVQKGGQFMSLHREPYNYFIADSGLGPGPYRVRVTDTEGNVIEDSGIELRPSEDVPSPGNHQFPKSGM